MKSACVGVLSIIELKNARWNIERTVNIFQSILSITKWIQNTNVNFKNQM